MPESLIEGAENASSKKNTDAQMRRNSGPFSKKELIRVVRTPENTVCVDLSGKKNGHGAYIQKSLETLSKARKSKALARALECEIPEEVYEELERLIHAG